tara:strand:+ start:6486 stop:7271 length:786 start_codon:yes stop_codon:yes gene_type:complete
MNNIIVRILIIILLSSCSTTGPKNNNTNNLTINWNSESGIKMLDRSVYKQDFYQLANFFQPQINPLYCGIASAVIVLNAINFDNNISSQKELEVEKPEIFGGGIIKFKSHSQLTLLNHETELIKKEEVISLKNINDHKDKIDPGLTLDQLQDILELYNLDVKKYHAQKYSKQEVNFFRKKVKNITKEQEKYILVNFNGKSLGLETGGHISPLAAYDEKSDSVLIMDVAGHKNGWYWVKITDLLKSMNSMDGDNYRGYLVVR